jgi:hypothetical protein
MLRYLAVGIMNAGTRLENRRDVADACGIPSSGCDCDSLVRRRLTPNDEEDIMRYVPLLDDCCVGCCKQDRHHSVSTYIHTGLCNGCKLFFGLPW